MTPIAWIVLLGIGLLLVWLMRRMPSGPRPAKTRWIEPEHGDDIADDIGVVPIEDAIDLHGFVPKEIPDVVQSYLAEAIEQGHREVRLIHGRGKGVQRRRVRALLERDDRVIEYGDAPAHRGGWGATLVRLRLPDN
jgi:DNA-nicking Smr family endonuclease